MEFPDVVGDGGTAMPQQSRRCPVDPDQRRVSLLLLVLVFLTSEQA